MTTRRHNNLLGQIYIRKKLWRVIASKMGGMILMFPCIIYKSVVNGLQVVTLPLYKVIENTFNLWDFKLLEPTCEHHSGMKSLTKRNQTIKSHVDIMSENRGPFCTSMFKHCQGIVMIMVHLSATWKVTCKVVI